MSEPVQLAKAAREQLAAALNALQTTDVPDELVDAAEPVAQAMGVLHRIERTNGADLDGRRRRARRRCAPRSTACRRSRSTTPRSRR